MRNSNKLDVSTDHNLDEEDDNGSNDEEDEPSDEEDEPSDEEDEPSDKDEPDDEVEGSFDDDKDDADFKPDKELKKLEGGSDSESELSEDDSDTETVQWSGGDTVDKPVTNEADNEDHLGDQDEAAADEYNDQNEDPNEDQLGWMDLPEDNPLEEDGDEPNGGDAGGDGGGDEDPSVVAVVERLHADAATIRPRKRQRDPESWKVSRERRARIDAIAPKPPCPENCRFKCRTMFTEEDRQDICTRYHSLPFERRRDVTGRLQKWGPATRPEENRITNRKPKETVAYRLECRNCQPLCQGHTVCRTFFLNTFHISAKVAFNSRQEAAPIAFERGDGRGKHTPKHALSPEVKQMILDHIDSFPRTPSHYCRATTQAEYLAPELSVTKMYQLFKEQFPDLKSADGKKYAFQLCTYSNIFLNNRNLRFFKPKKDQCAKCCHYDHLCKVGNDEAAEAYKVETRDPHLLRRDSAKTLKQQDKQRSTDDPTFVQATFDLESVLQVPYSDVSLFYYKRKLNVYNFTVLDHKTMDGHCFLWPEHEAKRGSCEVSSCLAQFLASLPPEIKEVSFYCDSCAGQNKNAMVASMLLQSISNSNTLESIQVTFLEPGHTQMEVDSIHSRVEKARKYGKIYAYPEWVETIRLARKTEYKVIQIRHEHIFDYKALSTKLVGNIKLRINEARIVKAVKARPHTLLIKYDYNAADFTEIQLPQSRSRKSTDSLQHLYSDQIPISKAKKQDLLDLLKSGAIPNEYRGFYEDLPCSAKIVDRYEEDDDGNTL